MIRPTIAHPQVAAPTSLAARVAAYQRRRMYNRFLTDTNVSAEDLVLDVGVTSDRTFQSSNYLEAWYPHKNKITAVGMDDASFLEDLYPGMRFVAANGLELPFEDRSFDIVHSSAVLEHVGAFENQTRFVKECTRVARKMIFLTTPNRWFPVEFHTVLPLLHWLPKPWFRSSMRSINQEFFAEESNLNLLSRRDLLLITEAIPNCKFEISSVSLGGWPSNLLLVGSR